MIKAHRDLGFTCLEKRVSLSSYIQSFVKDSHLDMGRTLSFFVIIRFESFLVDADGFRTPRD